MKRQVILDTGPLVALLNARDQWHDWTRRQLATIAPPLLTCEAVISEACFLVQRAGGDPEWVLRQCRIGLVALPFTLAAEMEQVATLMHKYSDVPMSLADACLVVMAQSFDTSPVLTLDSDFRIYRKDVRTPIPLIIPDSVA